MRHLFTIIALLTTITFPLSAQIPTYSRGEGVNLRILDDNVWDYSSDDIPTAWKGLPADPRDPERSKGFARLVGDWLPDIITFQEYSNHMHAFLMPKIKGWGYVYAEPKEDLAHNDTRIFFNHNTIELVEATYNLFTPSKWSNHESKSFSTAVFIHKATGRQIAIITTHLWWKSEKAQPGSNMARVSQAALICAEAAILKAKYNCPIFLTGDMNSREASLAIQAFFKGGFTPCYKLATEYADDHVGHHVCSPKDGYSNKCNAAVQTREGGAIDHCMLTNANDLVEIRRFDCVLEDYTLPLTDHNPLIIDAVVK